MWPQRRHGAQNAHDTPSKQTLANEFGTQNEDEVLVRILEGGIVQETEVGFLFLPFLFSFLSFFPFTLWSFFSRSISLRYPLLLACPNLVKIMHA